MWGGSTGASWSLARRKGWRGGDGSVAGSNLVYGPEEVGGDVLIQGARPHPTPLRFSGQEADAPGSGVAEPVGGATIARPRARSTASMALSCS